MYMAGVKSPQLIFVYLNIEEKLYQGNGKLSFPQNKLQYYFGDTTKCFYKRMCFN